MKFNKKNTINRREFIKKSVVATAGVAVASPMISVHPLRGENVPSNRVTIGCIGTGGMGISNLKGFKAKPGARIVAVCDVDAGHREEARELAGLDQKAAYNDFREVLARDDIDAVVVSTPDHWHIPISIAAVTAGKDVYCEKPLTLTIAEGRAICNAVKRYNRVFQTGSQQRSDGGFRYACELVRNGRIGQLQRMIVEIPGNNRTCPPTWHEMPIPEGFDYDMWLGPAPQAPYTKQRCHYEFRFILDYSGGQMTNWGAHYMDIAQWGNNTDNTGPVAIEGKGEFPTTGLFTTATNVKLKYTYANGVNMILRTGDQGVRFEGSEGWIFVNRDILEADPAIILTSVIKPNEIHLYQSNDHKQNFLDCIKLRQDPVTSAEIGHRSATICHLGNITMLLNRPLKWNPDLEQFVGDDAANRMLARPMRSPWHW